MYPYGVQKRSPLGTIPQKLSTLFWNRYLVSLELTKDIRLIGQQAPEHAPPYPAFLCGLGIKLRFSCFYYKLFIDWAISSALFWDRTSLFSPGWPQTGNYPLSASSVLGLQMWVTTPHSHKNSPEANTDFTLIAINRWGGGPETLHIQHRNQWQSEARSWSLDRVLSSASFGNHLLVQRINDGKRIQPEARLLMLRAAKRVATSQGGLANTVFVFQ